MENRLASHNRRPDPPTSARDGHMKENRRLGYQLKYESTNRSSELPPKKHDNGKDPQNEELVRYMSNLPSFLKKDVKLNEKTFSVGVLDWKQLEKWQNFHNIGNQHSSARSNFSSCSSTGGSSSHSSSCHSLPPSRQKLRYPTLQSHFYATPIENGSHDNESAELSKLKAQDCKAVPSRLTGVQKTIIRTQLSSDQKAEYRPKAYKEKDLMVTHSLMTRKSYSSEDVSENMKIPDYESSRRHHKMRTSFDQYSADEVYARKQETSRYEPRNKYPQIRRSLNLSDIKKIGSKKASHLSFSSTDNFEASCTELICNMPSSRPTADLTHRHIEERSSGASQDNKISNDLFQRFSDCGDVSGNTSGDKNLQEEKSIPAVIDQVLINPSKASNTKMVSWGTSTVRNPSPTRRFSFSLSRGGKVSNSSTTIGPSGAAEEAAVSSSSLNNSKVGSKGRSSPLRRLLDPLMRPARASLSDTRSSEPASKSSEGHGDSTAAHSVKIKLDLKTCKNVDAEVPHCSSKRVSSPVQALLQVSVRNGFPLFTFAVDNKNDILAATMRMSNSAKEEFSCIYSFFNVQELKKRSGGWINHGRKDKGNNFVPNIVAQMKVTDSFEENSLDQSISKEYVLLSCDTKQPETSNHELNDELAAVVVKILKKSSRHLCQNWQGNEGSDDSPTSMLKETHSLSNVKCNSGSGNIGDNQTEDQLCMTVLLPGGHHGQPIKGEPSSLVKRWQSGGSCDCGGWDLGCQMRVFTESAQSRQIYSSAKSHHANKLLELFSQEDGGGQKPVFSLAPFKDGIYAVEFNSSIEILQAFSIALSILSCLKPVEFVALRNGVNEKSSADITVSETGGKQVYWKTQTAETGGKQVYGKTQTEVSAFISNPPLSPVGRV